MIDDLGVTFVIYKALMMKMQKSQSRSVMFAAESSLEKNYQKRKQ